MFSAKQFALGQLKRPIGCSFPGVHAKQPGQIPWGTTQFQDINSFRALKTSMRLEASATWQHMIPYDARTRESMRAASVSLATLPSPKLVRFRRAPWSCPPLAVMVMPLLPLTWRPRPAWCCAVSNSAARLAWIPSLPGCPHPLSLVSPRKSPRLSSHRATWPRLQIARSHIARCGTHGVKRQRYIRMAAPNR